MRQRDLFTVLRNMAPVRHDGMFTFVTVTGAVPTDLHPIAMVAESEGISLVVPHEVAVEHGLKSDYLATWITLTVESSLDNVGLTAAVSKQFAEAGISCNVVAGFYHDHLFVSHDDANAAMKLLGELSRNPQLHV